MSKMDPIIAVNDVEASSQWYQAMLGCKSMHGGKEFEVLVDEAGETILCLHKWGEHEHPTMMHPSITPGNGLILYFRTKNMHGIRENAEGLGCLIEEEVHLNANSTKMEFSLRDPDGYYLTITEFHSYGG